MPYDLDAFLEDNGTSNRELFTGEMGAIEIVNVNKAKSLFPGVQLNESEHLSYFPYKLCHSLPSVNRRGRCFTAKVLQNSFASAVDQLLDIDHLILDNGIGSPHDRICGHIKAVRVGMGSNETASELAYCPTEPIPVIALGCLFNRANGVKAIIDSHTKGIETWKVSFECSHDWSQAYLRYDGNFIPIKDSDAGMISCIKRDGVLPFKERELSVCLGGLNGSVSFWGAGLTRTPADKDASILHFIAAGNREVANTSKSFYMPFQLFDNQPDFEVASKIEELASVQILGETDPDPDGETHTILTDMTVMPSRSGHDHMIKTMHVKAGSQPVITGVTNPHRVYRPSENGGSQEIVHAHTFSLKLKGKKGQATSDAEAQDLEVATQQELDDMATKVQDSLTKLNDLLAKLGLATNEADRTRVIGEIASVQKEIVSIETSTSIADKVEAEIQARVKAGSLLSKERADELITEKVDEATNKLNDEATAKAAIAAKKAERLQKLTEAGIQASYELEGMRDAAGNQMTISSYIDSIPTDANGDNQFIVSFSAWKQTAELLRKQQETETQQTQAAAAAAQQQAANQASQNGTSTQQAEAASKKPSLILPGGTNTKAGETANTNGGTGGTQTATKPGRKIGFDKSAMLAKY